MTENRQKLLDRIIRIYGYEHEITITFARLCELWEDTEDKDNLLLQLVVAHEEFPQIEDDE